MKDIRPNHRVFRSVDEWKSALMTLPDSSFFELLRSVLGNIKTPFSKQRLLDDLFSLLSRDEIRKTIAAYISDQDHKVIAAVAILKDPAPVDMETFFAGEFTSSELNAILINLEERLILYRFRHENRPHLALNPVLEQVLTPFIADTQLLFTSYEDEADEKEKGTFDPDDRIMAALFAFIQSEDELFKADAGTDSRETGIRKKVLDEGKKIFPTLDLKLAIRIFLKLGLVRLEGRGLVSCKEKVEDYCRLSPSERQEYWTAGMYLCLNGTEPSTNNASNITNNNDDFADEINPPWFSWNQLRGIAFFIHRFRSLVNPERKYPEITLRRLVELMEREDEENVWPSIFFPGGVAFSFENFLMVMEKTGLLEKKGTHRKAGRPAASAGEDASTVKPVIVMDTAFSFVVCPEISFADAMALGAFCSVKENTETTFRFELARQSVVRGFDQGIKADAMLALLERLSHNRLDANLGWTLKEWESRYAGVSLHQGIVLTLAEDRRYLAEAGPVSHHISKTLAPGVYLLSSEEKPEAVRALHRAGVDIVAQPPSVSGTEGRLSRNSFSGLGHGWTLSLPDIKREGDSAYGAEAASIQEKLRQALEKMKITKQERDELLARIERRLVLSEAQLETSSLRYEKLEARGLDYTGKTTIAKQAIENGSLLEVSWPVSGGGLNRTVGIPQTLEKKEGEGILVLRVGGNSENAARVFRIPIGKISLLRRIKQSIFGE